MADESVVLIDGLPILHLTAKLDRRDVSLDDFDIAQWMWPRMRAEFPFALAACLMPDHPHIVTPCPDPDKARRTLNQLLGRLAHAFRRPIDGFVDAYHRYVTSDPSVDVGGTPVPHPAVPTAIARYPLARIARAAGAAMRVHPDTIRGHSLAREIFVQLAREQGWRSWEDLALACGCGTRTIRRIVERPIDLDPARLCLADARLLRRVPRLHDTTRDAA